VTGGGNQKAAAHIPVMDYEGSQYRADFWVGQGRAYEDATERLALQRLMPAHGGRLAEIGAGFGRLADLYRGYEQVILFDYSRTLLQDAARELGGDTRFVFVAGNVYTLPLASNILDTLVMVRVMHHLADVPAALAQLRRLLHRHSVAVLEYANKRNLKAMVRWGMRKQSWSPFERQPVEFVELHYDFHPDWMQAQMRLAGFQVRKRFGVSHFRLSQLKQRVGAEQLAQADARVFELGGTFPVSPSVFLQAGAPGAASRPALGVAASEVQRLFRCPQCGREELERVEDNRVRCPQCGAEYRRQGGVWDLKEAVKDSR
jgi:ubiquinone/menaquinone biosynthesis C-methylase UbiE/DNA-directed RNA polymerase subunit RPC12/RpoP